MESKKPSQDGPIQATVRQMPGGGEQNESTPMEMRKPEGAPLSDGPNTVVELGRTFYKAASYKTARGNTRSDR